MPARDGFRRRFEPLLLEPAGKSSTRADHQDGEIGLVVRHAVLMDRFEEAAPVLISAAEAMVEIAVRGQPGLIAADRAHQVTPNGEVPQTQAHNENLPRRFLPVLIIGQTANRPPASGSRNLRFEESPRVIRSVGTPAQRRFAPQRVHRGRCRPGAHRSRAGRRRVGRWVRVGGLYGRRAAVQGRRRRRRTWWMPGAPGTPPPARQALEMWESTGLIRRRAAGRAGGAATVAARRPDLWCGVWTVRRCTRASRSPRPR
jgi:hypothetical protein